MCLHSLVEQISKHLVQTLFFIIIASVILRVCILIKMCIGHLYLLKYILYNMLLEIFKICSLKIPINVSLLVGLLLHALCSIAEFVSK